MVVDGADVTVVLPAVVALDVGSNNSCDVSNLLLVVEVVD